MEGGEEEFQAPHWPPAAHLWRGSPACPNKAHLRALPKQAHLRKPSCWGGRASQYPVCPRPRSPLTQTTPMRAIPSLVSKGQREEAALRLKAGPWVWGLALSLLKFGAAKEELSQAGTPLLPRGSLELTLPCPGAHSPSPVRVHNLLVLTQVLLGV